MTKFTFDFDVITPCFCAGAAPESGAEIRAPSIRGQLRWWYRLLGGFRSLAAEGKSILDQEKLIFGSTAGDEGHAGKLIVRVSPPAAPPVVRDDVELEATPVTDRGYLLFPLRNKKRGLYDPEIKPVSFKLFLLWRGTPALETDLQALITVFGQLGSLGFRSRRAMGSLELKGPPMDLATALKHFAKPEAMTIRQLPAGSSRDAITKLARWLKGWRSHGRTIDHSRGRAGEPPNNPGFPEAKKDHDAGLGIYAGPAYRAALGLPIIQFYSGGRRRANWDYDWDDRARRALGRFASPVILRPHRQGNQWRALIIFVDDKKWTAGRPVYLNGRPRAVSLDLYEKMKGELKEFP